MDTTGSRQNLIEILRQTRRWIARPDNDFGPTNWDGPDQALREIDEAIGQLAEGAAPDTLGRDLVVMFAATANLCELSLASGWADDYMNLAAQFDRAWERFNAEDARKDLRARDEFRK